MNSVIARQQQSSCRGVGFYNGILVNGQAVGGPEEFLGYGHHAYVMKYRGELDILYLLFVDSLFFGNEAAVAA